MARSDTTLEMATAAVVFVVVLAVLTLLGWILGAGE